LVCIVLQKKKQQIQKWKEITAKEIWNFDQKKKEKLESFGFKIFEVWESDFYKDSDKILNECILKIKERSNENME
jgi:G:T-mismatch repair DNA endonuclease (very short patch repair protein)